MRKKSIQVEIERHGRQLKALQRAIKFFNTRQALADALGVTFQAVQGWERTQVPLDRCKALENATRGKVKCQQVREDWADLVKDRPFEFAED